MAKKGPIGRLAGIFKDLNQLSQETTGMGLPDLAVFTWVAWGKDAVDRIKSYYETTPKLEAASREYTEACQILRLRPDFGDKVFLEVAYKTFQWRNHPDRGGDMGKAKAGNVAYETICRLRGWHK